MSEGVKKKVEVVEGDVSGAWILLGGEGVTGSAVESVVLKK